MKDALEFLMDKNHVTAYVDTPYKRWEKRNQLKKIDKNRLRSDQMASALACLNTEYNPKSLTAQVSKDQLSTHSSKAKLELVKIEEEPSEENRVVPANPPERHIEVAIKEKNLNITPQ